MVRKTQVASQLNQIEQINLQKQLINLLPKTAKVGLTSVIEVGEEATSILEANPERHSYFLYNSGTFPVLLAFDGEASPANFSLILFPGFAIENAYLGQISVFAQGGVTRLICTNFLAEIPPE